MTILLRERISGQIADASVVHQVQPQCAIARDAADSDGVDGAADRRDLG